jgi:Mg2+ and Co2+ transporter CorA
MINELQKTTNIHLVTTKYIKEEMQREAQKLQLSLSAYIIFVHCERLIKNNLKRG